MRDDIDPCRFCESTACIVGLDDRTDKVSVRCGYCFARGPAKDETDDAIAAWNTRAELSALRGEGEKAQRRYAWAANELLACDYGDNDDPDGRVGWAVFGWRTEGTARSRIYGASIDEAIDAARASIPTPPDQP